MSTAANAFCSSRSNTDFGSAGHQAEGTASALQPTVAGFSRGESLRDVHEGIQVDGDVTAEVLAELEIDEPPAFVCDDHLRGSKAGNLGAGRPAWAAQAKLLIPVASRVT
jgi:hypothetical protein